jgi:hypothetical protein
MFEAGAITHDGSPQKEKAKGKERSEKEERSIDI